MKSYSKKIKLNTSKFALKFCISDKFFENNFHPHEMSDVSMKFQTSGLLSVGLASGHQRLLQSIRDKIRHLWEANF